MNPVPPPSDRAADAIRILISREAAAKLSNRIAQALGGRTHELVHPDQAAATSAQVAFVSRDVTGLSTKHRIVPQTQAVYDVLAASRSLRWMHVHSAGADRPIIEALHARGVTVTTSSGANAPVVAQTAVLGLLSLARHWPTLLAAQRERRWAPLIASGLPRDLRGQTAVLIGWGSVGKEIGRLLQALGLQVVVVRHSSASCGPGVQSVPATALHEVLPSADWLVLACALTADTRGLIGARQLALLPAHCGVVNISRGDVVDESALIDALRAGRLAGAYLDVFAQEPLPEGSPLWNLPNVIVTPHSAGFSDGNEERVADMFLANLGRWARGEPLRNRVGAA